MNKYLTLFEIFFSLILLSSCQISQSEENENLINYSLTNQLCSKKITEPVFYVHDSAETIELTLLYNKENKRKKSKSFLRLIDKSYFELKINDHFIDEKVDSLYTLAFALKDTSYNFKIAERVDVSFWPEGIIDWRYTIRKKDNMYCLVKQHLINPSFVEEYIYNEKFKILKASIFYESDSLVFFLRSSLSRSNLATTTFPIFIPERAREVRSSLELFGLKITKAM